ncbi:MAG: response regulator transcription factor [Anaerolineae bacterium]|nr:MAG: response regulator transcription factor [Anaerolineae bacterium]
MFDEKMTLFFVDDQPEMRDSLRGVIESAPDMELVGEAASGEEALVKISNLQPNVVLMDIELPGGMNGIEATRRIKKSCLMTRVLILTYSDDPDLLIDAFKAGAQGYIVKGILGTDLLRFIRVAYGGGAFVSDRIAARLIEITTTYLKPKPFPELTRREDELLKLVAQGLSNTQAAQQLGISAKTVANHLANILAKLHIYDREELMRKAWEAGLGDDK